MPDGVDRDHIIRVGVIGPMSVIQGGILWKGVKLACYEINTNGGVINGEAYYFGIIFEDTFEADVVPNLANADAAVTKLIEKDKVLYVIGGFRPEIINEYIEDIMDEKMLFLSIGPADDLFAEKLNTTIGYDK